MKLKPIDILTIAGAYALIYIATCFMWIGAECVIEKAARMGTVDYFFAAYFAWSITRAIIKADKKLREKSDDQSVPV